VLEGKISGNLNGCIITDQSANVSSQFNLHEEFAKVGSRCKRKGGKFQNKQICSQGVNPIVRHSPSSREKTKYMPNGTNPVTGKGKPTVAQRVGG